MTRNHASTNAINKHKYLETSSLVPLGTESEPYHKRRQISSPIARSSSEDNLIPFPSQATLVDSDKLKQYARQAEQKGELAFAHQLWLQVLDLSPTDLEALERISNKTCNEEELGSKSPSTSIRRRVPIRFEFETKNISNINSGILGLGKSIDIRSYTEQNEYFCEALDNSVTIELARIPSGSFSMGCPDGEIEASDIQKPQHEVELAEFWMGKHPVTQAQWRQVAAMPSIKKDLDLEPSRFKGDNHPVEQVSWYDAEEFCQRLSKHAGLDYRLPTEAEWEYACRAGTSTPFCFGETITTDLANYNGNYRYGNNIKGKYCQRTQSVNSFSPNSWGLYGMHGNVWEWCLDHWHESYVDKPEELKYDGNTPWLDEPHNSGRLIRGGSWVSYPRRCRSAYRGNLSPHNGYYNLGFRIVCVL